MTTADDHGESLRMIRDSAAGISPRTGDFRRVRALRFTEPGFDRDVWRQMCDMGWPGLMAPEDNGGSGLGVSALSIAGSGRGGLMEELPMAVGLEVNTRSFTAGLRGTYRLLTGNDLARSTNFVDASATIGGWF